jgi:hypothetical protein
MLTAERLAGLEQNIPGCAIAKTARRDGAPVAELDVLCGDMDITACPTSLSTTENPAWKVIPIMTGNGDRLGRCNYYVASSTSTTCTAINHGATREGQPPHSQLNVTCPALTFRKSRYDPIIHGQSRSGDSNPAPISAATRITEYPAWLAGTVTTGDGDRVRRGDRDCTCRTSTEASTEDPGVTCEGKPPDPQVDVSSVASSKTIQQFPEARKS